MKKIKVNKIIVATTVSASIMMPNIMAAAAPIQVHNKNEVKDNKNNESKIGIEVGKIQVLKNVSNGTTENTTYVPENQVPATGDIGTTGTSFQYNVPIEFSSKTGKLYNLENPTITVDLNPSGVDGKTLTNAQQLGVEALENSINVQVQKYSQEWNSSGSYIFSTLIKINNALNGVQLNPIMTLNYKINGEKKEDSIPLGKILLTKKYSANIKTNPILENGALALHINYSKDEGNIAKYDINNLGYIDSKHNIKSLTFSISVPEGMKLSPISNPDFIINKNNTYLIKGNLLNEALEGNVKLFNIEYENKPISNNIGINLISEPNGTTFNNGEETENGTLVNYEGGEVPVQYIPKNIENKKQDKFNLESLDSGIVLGDGNMTNGIKTKFSAKINSEGGAGIAYVGSCITNGEGVITQNNKNLVSKNMIYVQLPTNILNELTTGTIAEKMSVMEGIINNEYPSYKEGESLKTNFSPNFVYTTSSIEKGESKVIGGSYIKIPKNYEGWNMYPVSASNTVVGILYNKANISDETMEAFKKSDYDGIEKIKNSDSILALISSPNELIQSTMNGVLPWNYTQSTFFRDGEFSHGVSASSILTWAVSDTRFDKFDEGATTYNERGHGISEQWLNEYKQADWLSQPHTINGSMGVNVATDGNMYKKDSYIRVNFGGNAIVTGNITFNGKVVPSEDVQINNTYAVIKIPKGTLVNLIKVTIPVQYTDMSLKSITTSMAPCNSSGVEQRGIYPITRINGYMNSWGMAGYADNTAFTDTVNFIHNTANVCQQYSNGVAKNNTTTITNVVNNLGSEKTTYVIAGRIPSANNDTLPASVGDLNVGNLGSTLENIDTNGADTWVLRSSKTEEIGNKEILDNPYPNTLAGLTQNELEKLGWIKYKKGMDLKNIGAYLVKVGVNPGASYTMHYKIKLTNVDIKKFQATNAEYKYYDNTNNVGSTSPVITLTPNGVNEGTDWMSSIVVQNYGKDSKGKTIIESTSELPENILNETIKNANDTFNNNPKLNDLISNGDDIENNIDVKTPEKLMKLIKFAVNNKEAFEKMGYKLDYISVNGVNIAPGNLGEYSMNEQSVMNWMENTGISNNTTLTKIKFIMSPLKSVPVTVSVKVVNSKNEVIQSANTIKEHTVFNGVVGSYLNRGLCKIDIPKGYELVKETINGEKIAPNADGTTIPEILGQSGEEVVYYIRKAPTKIDLKVEYPNGEILNHGEIENSGIPSEKTGMSFNGKSISFDGKEINIPDGYEIDETKVIDIDTNKLISTTMDKVNTVSAYRNYNVQIIVIVKQVYSSVTTEVIGAKGEVVVPVSKPAEIKIGTKLGSVVVPTIPGGWKIVGITTNGKEGTTVTGDALGTPNTIVYHVVKREIGSVTTEAVDTMGNVIVNPVTTSGYNGFKDTSVAPKIPNGYHLVKIVNEENKDVTGLPSNYIDGNQKITWIVEKNETNVDTTVKTDNGTIVVPTSKVKTIKTGSELSKVKLPKIPKDYEIIGYETDGGKLLNKVEGNAIVGKDGSVANHIIIIVKQVYSSVTTEVVGPKGQVVVPVSKPAEIKIGTKLGSVVVPTIPGGWKIVGITTNGKEGTTVTGDALGTPNTIVYHVVKREIGSVTTEVVDTMGNVLVNPVTTSGYNGFKDTSINPEVPNGYHLVKVVNGEGEVVNGVPETYGTKSETITWIVEKTVVKPVVPEKPVKPEKPVSPEKPVKPVNPEKPTKPVKPVVKNSSVTTIVETTDGEILVPAKTTAGVVGSKDTSINPVIPNGYHLVKVVNGEGEIVNGVPETYGTKSETITWIVEKNVVKPVVPEKPVKPVKPEKPTKPEKPVTPEKPVKPVVKNSSITTIVETTDGEVLVPAKTTTGVVGSKDTSINPEVPNGYHLVKVVNGEGEVVNGVPETYGAKSETITWIVEKTAVEPVVPEKPVKPVNPEKPTKPEKPVVKNSSVTTIVETTDGEILVPAKTTTGVVGSKDTSINPVIPNGYHLVKVVNGEGEVVNGVPGTYGAKSETITWIVEKNADKPVVPEKPVKPEKPVSPEKPVKPVNPEKPTKPEKPVVKNSSVTTIVETIDGEVLVPAKTTTGVVGSKDMSINPVIPNGYHLVKVVNGEGEIVNGVSETYGAKSETITWIVEKNADKPVVPEKPVKPEKPASPVKPVNRVNLVKPVSPEKSVNVDKPGAAKKQVIPEKSVKHIDKNINIEHINNTKKISVTDQTVKQEKEAGNQGIGVVSNNENSGKVITKASANPKTGDEANIPFVAAILGAIASLFALNKKKKHKKVLKNSR